MTTDSATERGEGQRLLLTATPPADGQRPAAGQPGDEVMQMAGLFTSTFGYRHEPIIDLDQTADQLHHDMQVFAQDPARRPDDRVVLYISGRAQITAENELMLVPANAEQSTDEGAARRGVKARQLVEWLITDTAVRYLTIMLDLFCPDDASASAAQADIARWASPATSSQPQDGPPPSAEVGVVLAIRTPRDPAPDAFSSGFVRAAQHLASGGHAQRDLKIETLTRVLAADTAKPSTLEASFRLLSRADAPAAFLLNPRYESRLAELDVRRQDKWWQDQAQLSADQLAAGVSAAPAPVFTGRQRALSDLTNWLTATGAEELTRPAVVTGGTGSGKSALLGLVGTLSDPQRRGSAPTGLPDAVKAINGHINAEIDASGRTAEQVFASILAVADVAAGNIGDMIRKMPAGQRPLTLLIDGIDEAVDPADLVRTILVPIVDHGAGRIRMLLGSQPELLPILGGNPVVINLDLMPYADSDGLRAFARTALLDGQPDSPYRSAPGPVVTGTAEGIADAAGGSYLLAQLIAQTASGTTPLPDPTDEAWRAALPRQINDAVSYDFQQRLGDQATRAQELMLPLAYAEGAGLPWEDVWLRLANALTPGRQYTNDDLLWLRDAAGSHVVESSAADRSVYRLSHRALAEGLREGRDTVADQDAIMRSLIEQVPVTAEGGREWAQAHPYTLEHLATHAAGAHKVDELLVDGLFLLAAARPQVLSSLRAAESDQARAAAAIYRRAAEAAKTKPANESASYLELAARCGQAPVIADAVAASGGYRPWSARWASWEALPTHRTITGHASGVLSICFGQLDGRTVIISGSDDNTVRVWEVSTGAAIGEPITGHTSAVTSVAYGQLGDVPVIVSGSDDKTVRMWDLRTGAAVGKALTGHTASVLSVQFGLVDGHPVVVSASADHSIRVWNPRNGVPQLPPITGHTDRVNAIAWGEFEEQPVVISGSDDKTIRMWSMKTGEPIGKAITGHTEGVTSVGFGELERQPVAISGSDDHTIRVWNLTTHSPIGKPIADHTDTVVSVFMGDLDGHPIAVSGSADRTIGIWDLTTGTALGRSITGHTSGVTSVALTHIDSQPIAISASHDHTIGIWDSAIDRRIGVPFGGHSDSVMAVAATTIKDVPVAVSGSADHSLRMWDLSTGQPIGKPFAGHTGGIWSMALGTFNGRQIAITGSADQRLRVWDLRTHQPLGQPLAGHTGWVWAVGLAEINGTPIAVSGSDDHTVRLWDLTTGKAMKDPLTGHTSGVTSLAVGELNGRPIAVSGSHDKSMRIWNLTTGRPIGDRLSGHTGAIWTVALGTINDLPVAISGSSDNSIRVWDLNTGEANGKPFSGHTAAVMSVALGELEGKPILVSGSDDQTVRIWDVENRRAIGQPCKGHTAGVRSVAIAALGDRPIVVSGSHDNTIRIWDLKTGAPIDHTAARHANDVRAVAITKVNNRAVAVSGSHDHTVRLWDLATGEPIGGPLSGHTSGVPAVTVGEVNGSPVAISGSYDDTVRVWNLASRSSSTLLGHNSGVTCVAYGQLEGKAIALSGSDDHTVRVWSLANGEPIGNPLSGHTSSVTAVAFALLEDLPIAISGSNDHTVRVWDLTSGRPIGDPFTGHTASVTAVLCIELDGHQYAVSGSTDQTVRFWELEAGRKRRWGLRRDKPSASLPELSFRDEVRSLAYAPETGRLVVGVGTGVEVRSLTASGLRIDLDSDTMAVAVADGVVGIGTESGLVVLDVAAAQARPGAGNA